MPPRSAEEGPAFARIRRRSLEGDHFGGRQGFSGWERRGESLEDILARISIPGRQAAVTKIQNFDVFVIPILIGPVCAPEGALVVLRLDRLPAWSFRNGRDFP